MTAWSRFKRLIIGRPIASSQAIHERLTRMKALAVLSSDALSSVAYATEESLVTLSVAGAAAFAANIPIALAISFLLLVVTLSYRQTIFAYPSGGGAYIVASENFGRIPGLTAASALLIDYVLTVSVSVSSGIDALTSAFPVLTPWHVLLGLLSIVLITVVNLRGIRESASIFALPTYLFVVSVLAMIGIGVVKVVFFHASPLTALPVPSKETTEGIGIFLLLKAFASGCSAMTGVEAISNGVPAFKAPESKHAAQTMVAMSTLLGVMFLGITFLTQAYQLRPLDDQTILSQLAHATIGSGWFYYVIQAATLLVLVLAANTSYADFPRLASILAKDGFMPRQFTFRGDRLAFSVGIVMLCVFSIIVLLLFHGNVSALIPLYAIGVFISFTLSQAGMVRHWYRERGRHWVFKSLVNGFGAAATLVVAVVAGITKFASGHTMFSLFGLTIHAGAWMVLVLIPINIMIFLAIQHHYQRVQRTAEPQLPLRPEDFHHRLLVPIAEVWPTTLQSLAYAVSIQNAEVTALHVGDDRDKLDDFVLSWKRSQETYPFLRSIQLVVIESPYRSLIQPILEFIDAANKKNPASTISVILAEMVPEHWWEQLLHNHTALRLKAALLFRPGVVVINVPSHLRRRSEATPPS